MPDDSSSSATSAAPDPTPVPQWTPTPRELDDLDLLVAGAFEPPLAGFSDGSNADGSLGASVTLVVPADVADRATGAGKLDLIDPEGAPLARLTVTGSWDPGDGRVGLAGPVSQAAPREFGPFRRLYTPPGMLHAEHPRDSLLAVPVRRALTRDDLAAIDAEAGGRTVLLLACAGDGMPVELSAPGLIRVTRAAAGLLASPTLVVAAAAAAHGSHSVDEALVASVAAAYADRTLALPSPATAPSLVELPEPIAALAVQDRPPRDRQGLVVFFTGLSGSGKSTLARALTDLLLERGDRTVTSLDGDVVRHHLSKGLGFSREDRETNILRIGFVAAEISRHGGVAICSPIAPFDSTRVAVRRMVEHAGGAFVLVHVATPLEVCEQRDRKGLYAKARAGLIPDFTGISSPYEEPVDALRVDTTDRSIEDCLADVVNALTDAGCLAS